MKTTNLEVLRELRNEGKSHCGVEHVRGNGYLVLNSRQKMTTPATLAREPHGLLLPGWDLF